MRTLRSVLGTAPSPSVDDTDIACAWMPVGGGVVTALAPFVGVAPALTRGPRGIMLAYGSIEPKATSGKTFRIHLRELEGDGASWSSDLLEPPSLHAAALQITSTPSGFFIAAFHDDMGFRVAHDLTTAQGPFPIGDSMGMQAGTENIVAIGDTVAINRAIPYESAYTVIDASNRIGTSLFVAGGVKVGHYAFLWADAGSFRAAWQKTFEGDLLQMRDLPVDAGRIEVAGLVDEFSVALSPVLFGAGTRLFDGIDARRVALMPLRSEPTQRVTHLTYAVRKR